MQNTTLPRTEPSPDRDALILASLLLKEVHGLVTGVHFIVAGLLRYVTLGVSITNSLIELVMPTSLLENGTK